MRFALFRISLLALAAIQAGMGQTDSERIQELEARVRQLENALRMVLDAQRGDHKVSANLSEALAAGLTEPATPPLAPAAAAAPPVEPRRGELPQELLPNLGKIGASVRFLTGTGLGSGGFARDRFLGGSAQLPLFNAPGGKIRYDLSVGTLRFDRIGGQSLQLLEIVPFGLSYSIHALDRYRIRPYIAAGLGNYVILSSAPAAGASLNIGIRSGGGIEWRFSKDAGIGWDYRYNWAGRAFRYVNTGPALFWHF
jgi:type II secretory pathway pseudopilin PulG